MSTTRLAVGGAIAIIATVLLAVLLQGSAPKPQGHVRYKGIVPAPYIPGGGGGPISVVQAADNFSGGGTTVNLSSTPTPGNLMVAEVGEDASNGTITAPAGWTQIGSTVTIGTGSSSSGTAAFYRVVVGGDGTSYTFTVGANVSGAEIWELSGASTTFASATSSGSGVSSLTTGSVTPAASTDWMGAMMTVNGTNATFGAWTGGNFTQYATANLHFDWGTATGNNSPTTTSVSFGGSKIATSVVISVAATGGGGGGGGNPPANVTPPTISGTATQGQTLTESHGSWTNSPTGYGYQWQDCNSSGASCVNVGGGTSQTYVLQASDVGSTMRVLETATNAFGASVPAPSTATAVVVATGGGGGGGSNTPPNPLCSPSACTQCSAQGYSVSAPIDAAGDTATMPYQVCRPGNLVNSSLNKVAAVFVEGGGTEDFNSNTCPDGGGSATCNTWQNHCYLSSYKCVEIVMYGQTSGGQHAAPATLPNDPASNGPRTCGPGTWTGGTHSCDEVPSWQAVYNKVVCNGSPPCQNIAPGAVYVEGASKGGGMTMDVACDDRTAQEVAGVSEVSNILFGPDTPFTTVSTSDFPNCPALGGQCTWWANSCAGSSVPCNSNCGTVHDKHMSIMWLWGTNDPNYTDAGGCAASNNCVATGYESLGSIKWAWGTWQMAVCANTISIAGGAFNPSCTGATPSFLGGWMGCNNTPDAASPGNQGSGNLYNVKWYSNCTNSATPAGTAMGLVQVNGGGHIPDTTDGVDMVAQEWNFWTRYPG